MTCAKQVVRATLVAADGEVFIGENSCLNPQDVCPRGDMPSGQGYELCKSVCQQEGHAEVMAILKAGRKAEGACIYLDGHTYFCQSCQNTASSAGVLSLKLTKE